MSSAACYPYHGAGAPSLSSRAPSNHAMAPARRASHSHCPGAAAKVVGLATPVGDAEALHAYEDHEQSGNGDRAGGFPGLHLHGQRSGHPDRGRSRWRRGSRLARGLVRRQRARHPADARNFRTFDIGDPAAVGGRSRRSSQTRGRDKRAVDCESFCGSTC